MIKALAFRQPAHPSAEAWADRCASVARSIDDVNAKVENLVGLAIYRNYTGGVHMAETVFDELRGLVRRREVSLFSVMATIRAESLHALMMCEYHRCLELVSKGLAQGESVGIHLFDFSLMCEGAHALMFLGDMAAAKKGLGELAICLHTARPWEMNYFHYLVGWYALHGQDLAQAAHYSELAIKGAEDLGGRLVLAMVYLQGAHVTGEAGDRSRSVELLDKAHRVGTRFPVGVHRVPLQPDGSVPVHPERGRSIRGRAAPGGDADRPGERVSGHLPVASGFSR